MNPDPGVFQFPCPVVTYLKRLYFRQGRELADAQYCVRVRDGGSILT